MSRIYNFSAGPSTLPLTVLEQARDELPEFRGCGMSILEMSHRSPEYDAVHCKAQARFRELLGLTDDYHVLFLGGGATLQFSMVPMNLLGPGGKCAFTLSGTWAKKAVADAGKVGQVEVVFDGSESGFTTLPGPEDDLGVDPSCAYLHVTANETVGGVQWHHWPKSGPVPLVSDMSSELLSRRLPIERFGLIYAGAQKNLGPAGATVVIIRQDLLDRAPTDLTAYLGYKTHTAKNSLYNTPPVYAIYMLGLVLDWLVEEGGLEAAEERALERSQLIYRGIEASDGFYRSPIASDCRSRMNVVFRLPTEELEKRFIAEARAQGMGGLKGHRSVGGCRASLYNAMPLAGPQALAQFMAAFADANG